MPKFKNVAFMASDKPEAKSARAKFIQQYGNVDAGSADVIVALGGDGFLLSTLHRHMSLVQRGLPIYGMNKGTVGFLMNTFDEVNLLERLEKAQPAVINPLRMTAEGPGGTFCALAMNEVALLRQTRQAAHIKIKVDDKVRLAHLIADGVMVATPAGSTAYNLSAHGPVLPLGAEILALTPISAFRPRRWRGALIKRNAHIEFDVIDPDKRPISATADDKEFRNITNVKVDVASEINLTLLFDEGHDLDEKILREQFAP